MTHRRGAITLAGLLAMVVLASSAAAQSPAPSSPTAADCGPVAALLPPQVDDRALVSSIVPGVAAIDPDELLDPLLASLGRGRADVCIVVFRYGSAADALGGQLLHIQDALAPDLAARFTDALRARLVAYDSEAVSAAIEIDGEPVWSLDVTAAGQHSQVLSYQLGDTLVIMAEPSAMGRLLPFLPVDPGPSPSVLTSAAPSG